MSGEQQRRFSRRDLLGGAMLVGSAGLLGFQSSTVAAEPPPETTRIRILQFTSTCQAALYVAEDPLHREGFTEVKYVPTEGGVLARNLAAGEVDIGMNFVGPNLVRLDAGDPVVLLAGAHIGCFELFGTDRVRAVRDLKGKTVGVPYELGSAEHIFISSILAYVGLDPTKDVRWATRARADLFAQGKIDAMMAFPPVSQEMRAKKIGHVILNSAADRPWSQYFCCFVAAHRDFVRRYPVATKRALRAILRGVDLIASDPQLAVRALHARGLGRDDYNVQLMHEIPYGNWRDYDPEDTVRFYALRLREAGMIKSSPQTIISQNTNWRFLSEVKKDLRQRPKSSSYRFWCRSAT